MALCLTAVMALNAQSKQSYLVVDQTNGVITYYYDANRSTHTNSYDVPIPGTSTLSYNDFWFNIPFATPSICEFILPGIELE